MATKATKEKKVTRVAKATPKPKQYEFQPKSFQLSEGPKPFISFRITRQTIYWLIILAVIAILTLWILKLQLDVMDILNNIELKR